MEYHPLTTVSDGSPVEFDVSGTGDDYVDFANTMLYVKAKITKQDGTNLEPLSKAGPTNLFLHSMFSQVDISLNGTLITSSTNTYPYRAMLETLLSYGKVAKKSQLTSAMYYKDTAGEINSVNFEGPHLNVGFAKRGALTELSKVVDIMGRIHADMFFQERYMLNEVNTRIKLIRSKDAFCVMGDANYKVKLMHASLFVRKVKVMPSVFLAHAKSLECATAKYPIRRVVCKSFTIPQHYRDVNHEKLFSSQLPSRLVIGMVDTRAFNGDRTRNPFNFQHFRLSEIAVYLDGQQQHAIRPIEPNFADGQYIRAYNTVFAGTGKLGTDRGLFIDREDFGKGYALYAFDLTADLGEDNHFSLVRQGNVRLAFKFADALANTWQTLANSLRGISERVGDRSRQKRVV